MVAVDRDRRKGMFALGRLKSGEMNRGEAAYAAHLADLLEGEKVVWIRFEGIKLRLGDNCFYTPDFAVMLANGMLELHEVKNGPWQEDARVKIKVAAEMYPFRFIAVTALPKKLGGGWKTESFD